MQKLKWGILGAGNIAKSFAQHLPSSKTGTLVAIGSRSREKAEAFGAELNVPHRHGSYEALLADRDVDAVYIATPHPQHAEWAIKAAEAGKHLLVEKPLGMNAHEVLRVADTASEAGLFAMEAMWTKFSPLFQRLIADLDAGCIGEIRSARASFGFPPAGAARGPTPFSAVLDRGIYPLALAHRILGRPAEVLARGVPTGGGLDSSVSVLLDYGGGRFAQVAASTAEYVDPSASISGTGGWVHIPAPFWAASSYSVHSGTVGDALARPRTVTVAVEGNGYVPMLRAAGEAILAGATQHPLHPLDDSVAVAEVIDAVRAQVARR
jgi:predicted dehydrogenase